MQDKRWQDWVMFVLGIWLFFSPFWMTAYVSNQDAAAWNSYIMGALVFVFAWGALASRKIWEEWLNLAIGIWLVIAPFVLAFYHGETGAAWNQIIVGIIVGLDALSVIARWPGMHVRT